MITGRDSLRSSLGWKNLSKDRHMMAKFLTFESDNAVKRDIVAHLYQGALATVDDLMEKTGAGRKDIMMNLTELELEGRISSDLLGRFLLVK